MSNSACVVETPIQLIACGEIPHMPHLSTADGWYLELSRDDHMAARKQLLSGPADQATAIISVQYPDGNRRYGFADRALISVSVAAVLRYNVFSRLLADLVSRYVGIPLVGYFDDFAEIIGATLGQAALGAVARFYSLMGFQPKDENSKMGQSSASLGLSGSTTVLLMGVSCISRYRGRNGRNGLHCMLPTSRKGAPSPMSAELDWAVILFPSIAFWEVSPCANARALYQKSHRRDCTARLPPFERVVFCCREEAVAEFSPSPGFPPPG